MTGANKIGRGDINWLGMEAPRYTSYPSAHHFSSEVGESQHQQWLSAIGENTSISIYVHIPFCKELCWFCGCHTKATRRYTPIAKYVEVLLKEIEQLKQQVSGIGKLINIHFGGGSPSLLELTDLSAIIKAISSIFNMRPSGELAIELDPRTTTPDNIRLYSKLGFNRVSVGIQDFDSVVQKAINRIQSYQKVKSIIDRLQQAGFQQINCDLIYGLPHQTLERFRDTLEKTITLNPSRIALFSYAHVPLVKTHQRMIDTALLPSETDKLDLYLFAVNFLKENGYTSIGIDHFAKENDPLSMALNNHTLQRNFQGYVTDSTDVLIGLGSSAISKFPHGYIQNSANTATYQSLIEDRKLAAVRGWEFNDDDIIRKQVIDNLMCFMSVDLADICHEFKLDIKYFQAELQALKNKSYNGIITLENNKITITTPYRMAARVIASEFDKYRGVAAGKYSKVG